MEAVASRECLVAGFIRPRQRRGAAPELDDRGQQGRTEAAADGMAMPDVGMLCAARLHGPTSPLVPRIGPDHIGRPGACVAIRGAGFRDIKGHGPTS